MEVARVSSGRMSNAACVRAFERQTGERWTFAKIKKTAGLFLLEIKFTVGYNGQNSSRSDWYLVVNSHISG